MRNAPSIDLTREEKDELSKTALRQTAATRDTLRARIILLAVLRIKVPKRLEPAAIPLESGAGEVIRGLAGDEMDLKKSRRL